MAPRATLILPVLMALAAAKGLNDYVPACGMPCLSDTISASTTCAADDNACLCEMKYTLKRNSEFCLQDKCDSAQYGQVMTGLDSFCRDASSGTSPTSPAPTSGTLVPTAYPTATPPTETSTTSTGASSASSEQPSAYPTVVPTVVPSGSVSSSGTTSIDTPTATYGTSSTIINTLTSTFVTGTASGSSLPSTTTTLASVSTTTQQAPTTPAPSQTPSSTPSPGPVAAGVQQRAGYATVAGGILVAAFFGL